MTRSTFLLDSVSVAHPDTGARLTAPAATRNATAITRALTAVAPTGGDALELASGTGQHVVAFARAMPGLRWCPTEVDPDRMASIAAHAADAALDNLLAPVPLDATAPGWSYAHAEQSLIVVINLLHLISAPETEALIAEAAMALAPGGHFAIYGPFLRDGATTSDGDNRFHASLRAQDPQIGYKDVEAVIAALRAAGLSPHAPRPMPANNLMLTAQKPQG